MAEPGLVARDISVRFGGVRAVWDLSVAVDAGETLAIVGPNGSGKSTLLNAISGLVPATGALIISGKTVAMGSPRRVRRAGVLRAFQTPQCFDELTCMENVLLTQADRMWVGLSAALLFRPALNRRERARHQAALSILETVGLAEHAGKLGGTLSYGQQRRLEIARCLAGSPRVLLLDEPSAGLNEAETSDLAELLTSVRDDSMAVVIVDHKIGFLESLCDRLVALDLGQVIAEGSPEEVWADERVITAYLGGAADA